MEDNNTSTPQATAAEPKEEQHKVKDIHFRVTLEQHKEIEAKAAATGRTISDYCRDLVIGYEPHLIMTDKQMEALTGFVAARSELVRFRSGFQGLPQAKRKQLFKSPDFMKKWWQYVNYLINYWGEIKDYFLDIHKTPNEDDSIRKTD